MFSLKKGCGDCVFLAAAILKLLFFYDLFLIIHFSNAFFKNFVVPEAFSAKDVLLGEEKREEQPTGRRTIKICLLVDFGA